MTGCPKRHALRKNQNPWGQGFFCVDLTENNSIGEQILNGSVLLPSTKMETIDLLISLQATQYMIWKTIGNNGLTSLCMGLSM